MTSVFNDSALADSLWDLVDEVVVLDMAIARIKKEQLSDMEAKRKLLVSKIERNMWDEATKVITGQMGKAIWVTQNRKSVDIEALCIKHSISAVDLDSVTKVNPVKFIKVSKK